MGKKLYEYEPLLVYLIVDIGWIGNTQKQVRLKIWEQGKKQSRKRTKNAK
jgi:hypothetical protein